jgi:membrane fusion protein (multidrug efflux system)
MSDETKTESDADSPRAGAAPAGEPVPPTPLSVGAPTEHVERRIGRRRRRWRGFGVILFVIAAIAGLVYWWVQSRIQAYTDNAYVVGNITPISPEVSGTVVALFADDNMLVRAGDAIAQIDPIPFQLQVDQASSDLKQAQFDARAAVVNVSFFHQDRKSLLDGAVARRAEAEQGVEAADYARAKSAQILEKDRELLASLRAEKPGLEALMVNARDYYDRFNRLASTGDVPVQERDNRDATHRDAVAKLKSLESNIAAAERQVLASQLQLREAETRLTQSKKALDNAVATVGRGEAAQLEPQVEESTAIALQNKVEQAEAKLRLARLNLSYTLIRAPITGIVSRRTIQLGQTLEARRPFLSIVPLDLDNVWIVANLREEQMARVRVGQAVDIRVDGIPERSFAGWVESVSGGTGSVFSLFPPDNATGNFVRIVQRLPVRVRFALTENYQNRIRPGMSARIVIDTMRFIRQSEQHW